MEYVFYAWLFGVAPSFKGLLTILLVIGGGLAILLSVAYFHFTVESCSGYGEISRKEAKETLKKIPFKTFYLLYSLLLVMYIVVPSENTTKLMFAAYAGSELVEYTSELEGIKEIPQNLVDFINNTLKDYQSEEE